MQCMCIHGCSNLRTPSNMHQCATSLFSYPIPPNKPFKAYFLLVICFWYMTLLVLSLRKVQWKHPFSIPSTTSIPAF